MLSERVSSSSSSSSDSFWGSGDFFRLEVRDFSSEGDFDFSRLFLGDSGREEDLEDEEGFRLPEEVLSSVVFGVFPLPEDFISRPDFGLFEESLLEDEDLSEPLFEVSEDRTTVFFLSFSLSSLGVDEALEDLEGLPVAPFSECGRLTPSLEVILSEFLELRSRVSGEWEEVKRVLGETLI
jgi:hypothetical protein